MYCMTHYIIFMICLAHRVFARLSSPHLHPPSSFALFEILLTRSEFITITIHSAATFFQEWKQRKRKSKPSNLLVRCLNRKSPLVTWAYGVFTAPFSVIAGYATHTAQRKAVQAEKFNSLSMPEITTNSATVLWSSRITARLCEVKKKYFFWLLK